MGRFSTGVSHNKKYSANRLAGVNGINNSKQASLVNFFQRKEARDTEDEPSTSRLITNEVNHDITSMSDHEMSSLGKGNDMTDSEVS